MKLVSPGYRRELIGIALAGSIVLSVWFAFALRFDFATPESEATNAWRGICIALLVKGIIYQRIGLHRGWSSIVGIADLIRILGATAFGSLSFAAVTRALVGPTFPRSIYVLDFLLSFLSISGARVCIRIYREAKLRRARTGGEKITLIYGAGIAGATLLKEVQINPRLGYDVVGFLDDSPEKQQETILDLPVLGTGQDLPRLVKEFQHADYRINQVLIAMPSAKSEQMAAALALCREAEVPCKTLPGLGNLLEDQKLVWQIRDLSVEDLLCRQPVRLEEDRIRRSISGCAILVTGAAGSIGSELCRQIARFAPRVLVALDRAESDLFRVDLELKRKFPAVKIVPAIADIREIGKVKETLCAYRPETIFHAAAYKHVPLMESHPIEAAANNILGTWNVACAAFDHGVQRFVMISSDKAVNPVNVMGATKRAAELIVSCFPAADGDGKTRFVSVRFGNVLGSNGSVVPIFQSQIAAGGPVTVTHPDIRRYFMTIPEATQLVLQASTMARGSDLFVLDMGEPIRIVDLARNMIRLAGFIPDQDIRIEFTGLRPGEKLFEELILERENIAPTYHEKIKIFRGQPADQKAIAAWLDELRRILAARDAAGVIEHLAALIPEYSISPYWMAEVDRRRLQPLKATRGVSQQSAAAAS